MKTARIFKNGKNQAVRLPREFEFEGVKEVVIRKQGDNILLIPARKSWTSFADLPLVDDDDFMSSRPALMDDKRVDF